MREASRTTRERMTERLYEEPLSASALAREFEIQTAEALQHVEHISRSVDGSDEEVEFLVAPPECLECGFNGFDDLINRPSRCPACKSESIEEPLFTIG